MRGGFARGGAIVRPCASVERGIVAVFCGVAALGTGAGGAGARGGFCGIVARVPAA